MNRFFISSTRLLYSVLDFCLDPAGTGETPAAHRLKNREEAGHDQNQSEPQDIIHCNDAGDETKRAADAAGDAALSLDVWTEEPAHAKNLPQTFYVASAVKLRQIEGMDLHLLQNENFLWASCVWGAVASGYFIYGWRQKAAIPLAAGAAMTAMSFVGPNALVMSLVCLAIIVVTWWLLKHGY